MASSDLPFLSKDFSSLVEDMLADLGSGAGGAQALTDTTEGSVIRTLTEVFSRELAVAYLQLEKVYQYGYLETAEGVALDNVVALLGVTRYQPGHVEGTVTFSRRQPAVEAINLPVGTLVAGRDAPLFQTIERATIAQGERQVTVSIRSIEAGVDEVESAGLATMPRPVWGVESVSNLGKLVLRQGDESDVELRDRTRNRVKQANRGTTESIEVAVRSLGIEQVTVRDQIEGRPGQVDVILGDADIDNATLDKVKQRVESVRPAGILVKVLAAQRIWVRLHGVLELDRSYAAHETTAIHDEVIQNLNSYVNNIGNGDRLRWAKINTILTAHESVMSLHPADGYPNYLEIFTRETGVETRVETQYLLKNNDVMPGPTDRISFDDEMDPVKLQLEGPFLDVWIDATIKLNAGEEAAAIEEAVTGKLNNTLDSLNKLLEGIEEGQALNFTFEQLAVGVDNVSLFRSMHDANGLTLDLVQADDQDNLSRRERISLRRLYLEPADG